MGAILDARGLVPISLTSILAIYGRQILSSLTGGWPSPPMARPCSGFVVSPSRVATVATLPSALFVERFCFRSVQVGCSRFSRCCHLFIDLGRWEGNVIRSDPGRSTLTVRQVGSNIEKIVHYDGATRWVSQEHGSKKINDIDPTSRTMIE